MKITVRAAALMLVALFGAWAWQEPVQAHHTEFQYKFPCYDSVISNATPPPACYVTQLDHGLGHALDFDPLGSAGLGNIPSMAEGTVIDVSTLEPNCTGSGLGQTVTVSDFFGRSSIYAHLSSISVTPGANLLQGDQLGVEGNSGNSYLCAPHLHWQPGTPPQYLDGLPVSSLTAVTDYGWAASTSVIGEYSTYGATLRSSYANRGGWSAIGWTYSHCPPTCTGYMFDNLSRGRMQDFRAHPDGPGGEFQTIQVAKWNQNTAYLVDTIFWQQWAVGGLTGTPPADPRKPISMALDERRAPCPTGSNPSCEWYQRFHLGYVWMGPYYSRQSVFCPDLTLDLLVDLNDPLYALDHFGSTDGWSDVNGDGTVDLTDALETLSEFGKDCYPL